MGDTQAADIAQAAFTPAHRVGLLLFSVLLLALVLELVRRRRFKERYALLWLATSLFGLLVGVFPGIIVSLARVLHVQFLTVFFALAFTFLLGLVLSFSIVISRLSEQNRELAQEAALLAHRLKMLEDERAAK
jgi:hypothetical protein